MAAFRMKIAGKTGEVNTLFESTREYCRRYLTAAEPDFSVTVTREDLVFEQKMLDKEADEEGLRRRRFGEPFLERTVIQRGFAEKLFDSRILLLHGSAVAVDGAGYLFTADCGTGKSTHTRLYREVFGDRAVMINDDKPFLHIREDGVWVCGSPWSGKHGLDTNLTLPLKGICILERGKENRIHPIPAEEALPMLRKQSYCPLDPGKLQAFGELVEDLAQHTPLWRMACTPVPQAAEVSYRAMSGAG